MRDAQSDYQSWLWGEILLAGLLGASLALFLVYPVLQTSWDLPELRLVLQTTMALAGLLVAVLATVRFSVEGRRLDLLLCTGFFVQAVILSSLRETCGTIRRLSPSWCQIATTLGSLHARKDATSKIRFLLRTKRTHGAQLQSTQTQSDSR